MGVSFAEAVARLISGAELSWKKFESHKAGAITLGTAGQRRLFEFLIKQPTSQVAEGNEALYAGLVAAWADEKRDPASGASVSSPIEPSGPWRLERIESKGFGGLNIFNGPQFDLPVGSANWCLEGQNGAGKTSLVGVILWTLTGKRIREQEGLVDDDGQRAPVFDDKGTQIGKWPPLAAYPTKREDLKSDVTVWARLTFKDKKGDVAIASRKVLCPADDTKPPADVSIDPRLLAVPQLIETGLLMPARLPRIGFGDRSQSLYEAVKLLTGLDQLSDVAEGAASFTSRAKRFLKYAKDNGADGLREKFEENIAKAEVKAEAVSFDVSGLKILGQKNVAVHLREAAQKTSSLAGEHLAKLKSEIATGVDTTKADGRAKVKRSVALGRAILTQGTKGIAVFELWTALETAIEDAQFKKVPEALASTKQELLAALAWHSQQTADHKFRLKALASHYHVVPSEGTPAECPLCGAKLTSAHQQKLAAELAKLKKDAEAAERKIDDVCAALDNALTANLPLEIKKHFDVLSTIQPQIAYATAIQKRFSDEPPFSDVLTGIAKSGKATVAWPVPGLEDTELGVFMKPEVGHGTTAAYSGVQA